MNVSVSLRDLTRSFGDLTAVDGLSFDVGRGELFGIVGPDGAGKTTTLRMLAGVLRPTSGTAVLEGVDVAEDPEGAKLHLAYMAQRFGLYEDLTVAENLAFYADLYSVPKAERPDRLERLYTFSRLDEFTDRLAGNLSGGMKQKLSLSCCLVHRPKVLLLDEPTFGVDPISRRELWLILHEMVEQGVTVIVSTSYLDEAERCDRVILLNEGQTMALDEPHRLQSSLEGTMLALRTANPRGVRDALNTMAGVSSAALFGDAIHTLLEPGTTLEAFAAAMTAQRIEILDQERIEPSLEDVFIHLVGAAND
ncbi:MAG: ABC transporter ATP-binding protein [Gemmatimonadales bacterium]|nr:ABC transporter ATP-binding protein [Gemmatimonadales bacterium]MBT3497502.1 ABC transporter ATP-binding protein [Gemmatimonadales bacterium]MBT3775585.1 ABC transporter ATP-binding protein [Gemmatimonadales bacterium]MBT3958503.1 ABC transporter ATP-binding protein [Gemmatimonadales bacterium]MBT4185966.1 ABC transporter ATP-binding protein [Gemmatimonadales bacterium]